MDPSGVLLALEEQKKWRERKERIQTRVKQLERRRAYLEKELTLVRKKAAEYGSILVNLRGPVVQDRLVTLPVNR